MQPRTQTVRTSATIKMINASTLIVTYGQTVRHEANSLTVAPSHPHETFACLRSKENMRNKVCNSSTMSADLLYIIY